MTVSSLDTEFPTPFLDLESFECLGDGAAVAAPSDAGYTLAVAPCPTHGTDTARWNVLDADQRVLAVVAQLGGRRIGRGNAAYTQVTVFRVVTAGPMVEFDEAARHPSVNAAARAALDAREQDTRHIRGESGLTPFEMDVLDFEEKFMFLPADDGTRLRAIHELLDINATRYYQLLGDLIRTSDPRAAAALAYSPTVVNRLRRLRAARRLRRVPHGSSR